MSNGTLTPEMKTEIDEMSRHDMCRMWRHASVGNPYFIGEVGQYFKDRLFKHHGGFSPQISKSLG